MKRLMEAVDEFSAAQQDLLNDPPCQRNQRFVRHYQTYQRLQSVPPDGIPHLALHYALDSPSTAVSPPSIQRMVGMLITQDDGFPTTFLLDTVLLIVDTGASITITPDKRDFLSPVHPVQPTTLQGIAAGLQVQGIGRARYNFPQPSGQPVSVILDNMLYVLGCSMRLLCPRHLAHSTGIAGDGFTSCKDHATLRVHGIDIPVAYHTATGLPIIYSIGSPDIPLVSSANLATPSPSVHHASVNSCLFKPNLSKSQHLKLLMHERCNHRNMSDINRWIRE